MNSISHYLGSDHHGIDEFFADAAAAAACSEWRQCLIALNAGQQTLLAHIQMEEKVLFPEFEAASSMEVHPIYVLRTEHQRIRDLLAGLQSAAAEWNNDAFLLLSGDLHHLLYLHNQKEEQMFYPLADRIPAGRQDEIIAAMQHEIHLA